MGLRSPSPPTILQVLGKRAYTGKSASMLAACESSKAKKEAARRLSTRGGFEQWAHQSRVKAESTLVTAPGRDFRVSQGSFISLKVLMAELSGSVLSIMNDSQKNRQP